VIDEAGLARLRMTLEADGYGIDVSEEGPRLLARITATPEACADCLVPKPLMLAMLERELGVPGGAIELSYPGERS
jgi:hypothetical protein